MLRTVLLITKPGSELLNRFLTSNPNFHLSSRDPRNPSLRRSPILPGQALDAYSIYPPGPLRLRSQLAFFSSLASFLSDRMEDGAGGFEESWETGRDTIQEICNNFLGLLWRELS